MTERVFIKVVGFTDGERHALNTVFRLSEGGEVCYSLWAPELAEPPRLLLLDGQAYEARVEAETPRDPEVQIIWVGEDPPAAAWRVFQRPLAMGEVVQVMDQLFTPPDLDLAFDEERGGPDTQPSQLESPARRALIASADRDQRLYLRAKLALMNMTQADEAESADEAMQLLQGHRYDLALVDFALPGAQGWTFLRQLGAAQPRIAHVVVTKPRPTLVERVRAWLAGAEALLAQPPDPVKLNRVLVRV